MSAASTCSSVAFSVNALSLADFFVLLFDLWPQLVPHNFILIVSISFILASLGFFLAFCGRKHAGVAGILAGFFESLYFVSICDDVFLTHCSWHPPASSLKGNLVLALVRLCLAAIVGFGVSFLANMLFTAVVLLRMSIAIFRYSAFIVFLVCHQWQNQPAADADSVIVISATSAWCAFAATLRGKFAIAALAVSLLSLSIHLLAFALLWWVWRRQVRGLLASTYGASLAVAALCLVKSPMSFLAPMLTWHGRDLYAHPDQLLIGCFASIVSVLLGLVGFTVQSAAAGVYKKKEAKQRLYPTV